MSLLKRNIILMFFFCYFFIFPVQGWANDVLTEPTISAESAILMDAKTGRVLFAKNPYQRRAQASTTKITTTIIALEKGKLTDRVTISERAADTGESSIWLEKGEVHTLEDLLYAVMLYSANDAAVAVAEHIGGTEDKFIQMMNDKVKVLGARETNYTNPHGLDNPLHYSTAYDLAIIARYAMANPKFREITATSERYIPWEGHPWERKLETRDKLLSIYEGADGVKTGTTDQAGKCFVGSATRQGFRLISVVLNSGNVWADTPALLDFGFNNYQLSPIINKHQKMKTIPVSQGINNQLNLMAGEELLIPLRAGERERIKIELHSSQLVKAPVERGQKLGQLIVLLDGQVLAKTDLVAGAAIKKKFILRNFWETLLAVLKTFSFG